ncbi:MAG: type II toxin-antitoxin system Phd/YefM family antitoxin [Acidobacteria bacterium]|nr:type II toxin-antitoxin system Phd/YefM family antitoxin [Acidobacteriota bacterium]
MRTQQTPATKGAEEARQQLPSLLADADAGLTTLITRHGRIVAAIVPADAVKREPPASLLALAGSGKGLWGGDSARAIAEMRNEWNR